MEVKLNLNKSFLRLQLILGIGVRELLENCGKNGDKIVKNGESRDSGTKKHIRFKIIILFDFKNVYA